MKRKSDNLEEDLKSKGATDSEVSELLVIAANLKRLKTTNNLDIKPAIREQKLSKWGKPIPIVLTTLTGLVFGMFIVVLSQTVLPGSALYPVQKLSDNVSMSLDPNYRGTVMMKRAQEVKQLVADHATSNLVIATLADYQTEASAYKSVPANYTVFEYCKANLQQAAVMASNSERQDINDTLSSLSKV